MLTKEQIQHLFRFCEQHYVYYYDVQVELVDHLAQAIETEMTEDPEISFEYALDRVYDRFGIFGFSTIVREKSKQLFKEARKNYWQLVAQQFRWPRILKSLTAGAVCYTIFALNGIAGLVLMGFFFGRHC